MYGKKVLKNTIWSLTMQVVTIICGFLVPRFLIKEYGSEINGITVSITQFLSYISLLEVGFGPVIKSCMYKPIAENNQKKIKNLLYTSERFFRKISYYFIIYILVLSIVYPLIINTNISRFTILGLIIIISISTFIEYYYGITYMLFLQAKQENHIIYKLQIITKILNLAFIILLIKLNSNILIVKFLSSLIFILKPICQYIYVRKKHKICLDKNEKMEKIPQKKDGMAQHIAYIVHNNTDVVVLSLFTNISTVSIYSIYLLVVNSIKSVIECLTSSIEATFGEMIAKKENLKLNEFFSKFECCYYICINALFSCAYVLIIPFIKLYTKNLSDVNYILPLFAFIILTAEYVYSIRKPYNSLVFANGDFKKTMLGSWIEAIINVLLSIILVFKFGIVGVAIGTSIAMLIRTIEIVLYASKNILQRKYALAYKSFLFSIVSTIITVIIGNKIIGILYIDNYIKFFLAAISISIVSLLVSVFFSFFYDSKSIKSIINKLFKYNFIKS